VSGKPHTEYGVCEVLAIDLLFCCCRWPSQRLRTRCTGAKSSNFLTYGGNTIWLG